ncbi:MAG: dTMP kinase [Acidobacteria bacterium]|nr:dTMP kinase [Acidobacteriota bacterium]
MPPFISFEGLDGCGKTTQVKLLADYLARRGIQAAVLREPGGTPVGEAIRKLLLSSRNRGLLPLSELLLYYAARNQNLCQQIIPAQAEGKWVLCDRFADASAAYQGYGRGLDLSVVETLDRMVNGGRKPDLTLLIDIEPSLSLARARDRNRRTGLDEGRFEAESLAFFHRVREGYLQIAAREPGRVRVLDGSRTIQALHREVVGLISPFLSGGQV